MGWEGGPLFFKAHLICCQKVHRIFRSGHDWSGSVCGMPFHMPGSVVPFLRMCAGVGGESGNVNRTFLISFPCITNTFH